MQKKEEETASNALVTDYNYLIIQLKKWKSSVVTILEDSKFYFQIEDISIWHDTPSKLTSVLKKSSGQDGQLCYGAEPPYTSNRHWHCHNFSGLLGWSLDNPRSCNYLRVSTVFYPSAYYAWYAEFKPHVFFRQRDSALTHLIWFWFPSVERQYCNCVCIWAFFHVWRFLDCPEKRWHINLGLSGLALNVAIKKS